MAYKVAHKSKHRQDVLANSLFFAAALTSSFDIFLTFDFFGFNVRISMIFQGLFICYAVIQAILSHELSWPKGYKWIVIFLGINTVFTFNTIVPQWNIAYDLWLLVFVAFIWAVWQLYKDRLDTLLELYFLSYYVLVIWGCIQFVLGYTGLSSWMITQWWQPNFPRANGFTYEASYYGTYVIMCYLTVQICCFNDITRFGRLSIRPLRYLSAVALVLCSSRMVFIPVVLTFLLVAVITIVRIVKDRTKIKKHIIELVKQGMIFLALFAFFLLMQMYLYQMGHRIGAPDVLLGDVGINSAHRLEGWKASWKLFLDSPILGRGLGAVDAEASRLDGASLSEILAAGRGGTTGNVFLEVLAATGIFGVAALGMYGWHLAKPLLFSRSRNRTFFICLALMIALLGECMLLAMNQNILRIYAWIHVAVTSCAISILAKEGAKHDGAGNSKL